jgi:hypothetical protein
LIFGQPSLFKRKKEAAGTADGPSFSRAAGAPLKTPY